MTILKGAFDAGRPGVAVAYLLALAIVFIGMATVSLRMVYGTPPGAIAAASGGLPGDAAKREPLWSVAPASVLGLAVFALGIYVPPQLTHLLRQAVVALRRQLMATDSSLVVHNGHAFPLADCPLLPIETFRRGIIDGVAAGGQLSALFAFPGDPAAGGLRLFAALARAESGDIAVSSANVGRRV